MQAEETYAEKYGELLTLAAAAKVIDRSTENLRISLYRKELFWQRLSATKIKIGRRIHFKTNEFFDVVMDTSIED